MPEICQTHLPVRPWADPRLARMPGLVPIEPGEWLQVDDAYAAQVAYRQALVAREGSAVLRADAGARPAVKELFTRVLSELDQRPDFSREGDQVVCPDGRKVTLDRGAPLAGLSALVQEDFCILQKPAGGEEHVLTAALLCFPASWTLAQKFLRPLVAIHTPVASYDGDIARRVQRLFDGVQPSRPIWRANALIYGDPELYQPRREEAKRDTAIQGKKWVRIERQSIVKLEQTGAVVFSIHSYVMAFTGLSKHDISALEAGAT